MKLAEQLTKRNLRILSFMNLDLDKSRLLFVAFLKIGFCFENFVQFFFLHKCSLVDDLTQDKTRVCLDDAMK